MTLGIRVDIRDIYARFMNINKPIIVYSVTGLYSVFYILYIIITSIISEEFPNFQHNEEQALTILFVFCMGILISITYSVYLFPSLRETIHGNKLTSNASPYEVLSFISTKEEIAVLEAIKDLSPKAYKFEIARSTELSRMKVHRILLRLSERGIVDIKKNGKHSQIYLAEWLKQV